MKLVTTLKDGQGRSKQLTAETLINMYAEKAPEESVSPAWLVGSPGMSLLLTCGIGPLRAFDEMNGILYAVSGTYLYSITSALVVTNIGVLAGMIAPVIMVNNGTQLFISSATAPDYIYSVATGIVAITDPDFPGATSVDYLDGYFISTSDGDTGQFQISAILDGTNYDALDFATAESSPDPLVRVFVDHREILLFGTKTMEPWFNSGASAFPFERIPQAITQKGIASRMAVARTDNTTFWLDHTGVVRKLSSGYVPTRVSTHDIEFKISQGDISTAEAFGYTIEGHECFVLTVTGAGTFIYDAATGLWHQRQSYGLSRWRASCYAYFSGRHFVGDYANGNVYELSLDTFVEGTDPLVAEMIFPPIANDGNRFTVDSITLAMEVGIGDTVTLSPQATLQTSKDGRTWSNHDPIDLGAQGEYETQVQWNRVGQYRNLHCRFLISDPVKRAVYTAYADIRGDDQ